MADRRPLASPIPSAAKKPSRRRTGQADAHDTEPRKGRSPPQSGPQADALADRQRASSLLTVAVRRGGPGRTAGVLGAGHTTVAVRYSPGSITRTGGNV